MRKAYLLLLVFLLGFGCFEERVFPSDRTEQILTSETEDLDDDGLFDYAVYTFNPVNIDDAGVRIQRQITVSTKTSATYTSINPDLTDVDLVNAYQNLDEFSKSFEQLPEDWDMAWVGTCCDLHAHPKDGLRIAKANGSRCTHAYIISNLGANKILEELRYCNDGADFYYNYLIDKFKLNNYWFEPALAVQSAEFKTTIQN